MVTKEEVLTQVTGGAVVAGAVYYGLKPSLMFDKNGVAKQWDYWQKTNDLTKTPVPWWLAASFTGLLTPLFF